jgi:CarD family transcriptional regulator
MFQIGDLIIYGGSNCVCRVVKITKLDFQGIDKDRVYYVLKPIYQDCIIYSPVDNENMLMRPIITKDEADKLIDKIPEMKTEAFQSNDLKQIAEHYESMLNSRDCAKLIELTMSIYEKKNFSMTHNGRFGTQETGYLKKAENMLFGELAIALNIPLEQVQAYIATRVSVKKNEKTISE